ncbi:MAG: indolepyruvate ferredoxin oxidoreductase family protein [Gammaproteobacteria bacterium]|nr:indolepyruvate ferredoxin oxidoreductase family protein [Gammaproteobacteria bacterium]
MLPGSHEAATPQITLDPYQLADRYLRSSGRVYLTGTQALVRVLLDQARRDLCAGLDTGGFVSGYRGSPLGGLDLELWRCKDLLEQWRIDFLPAVNEDLGATAVLGAQQVALDPECDVEGLFSLWYGKGPGVDRSGDALKHGNAYGSSPKGGVLVVAGDDHGCVSSSMPHQSDVAFMSWFMPTLNPASVSEYLTFGEYGYALSRFSGTWVGFKAVSETVESAQSIELCADRRFNRPDYTAPPGGLHIRSVDLPSPGIETRIAHKLAAVEAFVEANPIDRRIYDLADASFGIVTTGKAHLDLMEALRLLGLNEARCRLLGIDIYKVGMVWPLARRDALAFVRGKREVLVVEEKRGIIESQFKEYFYDWPGDKPEKMVGKHRAAGDPLIPWTGELSPLVLVPVIAERLSRFFPEEKLVEKAHALTSTPATHLQRDGATRTPYFCSGCPHNSSTKVPEGSVAGSGIGCHVMASWMDRSTVGYAQMGGEGVPWVAASPHLGHRHMFQNIGEGTWYHSGSLAIRQAVSANTNITFKILFNDAVAMTGGQPVDGPVSVEGIAETCRAEGVHRIAIVSDNIQQFQAKRFPVGTTFHPREQLQPLQRELREVNGVSILIYEQACATEKRRRRKRGTLPDPKRYAFINELVCEGCGDCSKESNCLSVEPLDTPFGTKRKINLSTCNKDFSCLNGFCPSFVTIEGATRKPREGTSLDVEALVNELPVPPHNSLAQPYDLLVAGVGGTGVVTVGALITMAAHLEGKGASVLDFTGFAQKFGTVIGFVRLAASPDEINQVRIDTRAADAVIACDAVVASSPKASAHYRHNTRVVLNLAEMPTGDLVLHRDANLEIDARREMISSVVGTENLTCFDANEIAESLMGDAVYANVMMLGAAWQQGLVPVSLKAMLRAFELNNVEVKKNIRAFSLGRILAVNPAAIDIPLEPTASNPTLDTIIEERRLFLESYQNAQYAERFKTRIERFQLAMPTEVAEQYATLAARSLFKLMAYKDEYEVARLHTATNFEEKIAAEFDGDYRIIYHFAPPGLTRSKDARGRPVKRAYGPWIKPVLKLLARLRFLRGTPLDVFGYSRDRKLDRELLAWFERQLDEVEDTVQSLSQEQVQQRLSAPMEVRGYGPVRELAAGNLL